MSVTDDPGVYLSCAFICRKLPPLLEYTHFASSFVPNKIYRLIINRCLHWPREIYSFIFSAFGTAGLHLRRQYFVFNWSVLAVQLLISSGRIFQWCKVGNGLNTWTGKWISFLLSLVEAAHPYSLSESRQPVNSQLGVCEREIQKQKDSHHRSWKILSYCICPHFYYLHNRPGIACTINKKITHIMTGLTRDSNTIHVNHTRPFFVSQHVHISALLIESVCRMHIKTSSPQMYGSLIICFVLCWWVVNRKRALYMIETKHWKSPCLSCARSPVWIFEERYGKAREYMCTALLARDGGNNTVALPQYYTILKLRNRMLE